MVAVEDFACVLFGGGADVATLGVQDHRHAGRVGMDEVDQPLELVLGALGGEIGDLRLEGAHQVVRGFDDGRAEVEDARRIVAPGRRKSRRFGVQAHAQHRRMARLHRRQLLAEVQDHLRASGSARPV